LSAERVAAERAVEALGGSMGGEIGVLVLRSPLKGRVIDVHARTGQTVESKDTLFTVADLSQVWAELSVFERDLGALAVGDEVEIRLPSDRAHVYRGAIAHIGETIEPGKRAATVRVELENPGPLRSGLSVTATIHGSGRRLTQLRIPREAVPHRRA
jgi:cobalt-zinc-cadmium efflux system membrane fusion protein